MEFDELDKGDPPMNRAELTMKILELEGMLRTIFIMQGHIISTIDKTDQESVLLKYQDLASKFAMAAYADLLESRRE